MDRRLNARSVRTLLIIGAGLSLIGTSPAAVDPRSTALAALEATPIFDGHNDLAIHFAQEDPEWSLERLNLSNLPGQSTLAAWRSGHVGGALITTGSTLEPGAPDQFRSLTRSFDWFDTLVAKHSREVAKVTSLAQLQNAHRDGKIALMMAIEGGEQIDGALDNLRTAYRRGVRSMTIIYNDHNAIGDGSMPSPTPKRRAAGGLTPFGKTVIAEMNRLGMIVDLSHAAETSAQQAIAASKAPVLFSHSGARALVDSPRNLSDETLRIAGRNGGLVMVPLVPYFTSQRYWDWWSAGEANYAQLKSDYPDDPKRVSAESRRWDAEHPAPAVEIADVADHIDHIARVAGFDHVGIGSDFDGMGPHVIPALADSSALPDLFTELARRGWSRAQLEALAGGNFQTFLAAVEKAAGD